MPLPNSSVEDVQTEYMASLIVHGIEAGYTLEDERLKQLFATAMLLETLANTAIDKAGALYGRKEFGEAIKGLTYVIEDGERYFAQHPRSLAEEAYGYTLAHLYYVRTAGWLGASGQSGDGASQLQRALNDANKALSYPAKYYEFINSTLSSEARSMRDLIQTMLKESQQGKVVPKRTTSTSATQPKRGNQLSLLNLLGWGVIFGLGQVVPWLLLSQLMVFRGDSSCG